MQFIFPFIVLLAFGFDSLSSNSYMVKIAMEAMHHAHIPMQYLPHGIALTFGLVAVLLTAVYLPWVNNNRDSIANTIKEVGPLFAWMFFFVALTTSALSTKDMSGMIVANAAIMGQAINENMVIIVSLIIMWMFGLLALAPLKKENLLPILAIPGLVVAVSLFVSFFGGFDNIAAHVDYNQFGTIVQSGAYSAMQGTFFLMMIVPLLMISGKVACGATGCELGQFLQSFFPTEGPLKPKLIMYGTLALIGSMGVFGGHYVVKFSLANGGMEAIMIALNGLDSIWTQAYLIFQPMMLGGATYSVVYGVKQNQGKIFAIIMLALSTLGVFLISNTEAIAPYYVTAVFGMMLVSSVVVARKLTARAWIGVVICTLFLGTLRLT